MSQKSFIVFVCGFLTACGAWAQPVPPTAYNSNMAGLSPQAAADGASYEDRRKASARPSAPMLETTDRSGRWDLGLGVSGALSDDSASFDDTAIVDGRLSYGFNRWLGLGLEAGWQQSDFHDDDLTAVPLFAQALVRFPNETPWVPYGTFGLGAIVWDLDESSLFGSGDLDADASFAMKAGGGVDYFISDHWALFGEAAYIFTDEDIEVTSESRSVDLDYWTFGGGVKFVF